MATNISIVYPRPGTNANNPTKLPSKFVAFGTKDANEVPMGMLVSVGGAGKPNGKAVIGGTRINYKKKNTTTGALEDDDRKWALVFNLGNFNRNLKLSLIVFDGRDLPAVGATTDTTISLKRVDHLAASPKEKKKSRVLKLAGSDARAQVAELEGDWQRLALSLFAIYPPPSSQMAAAQFVAYGDLPAGSTDVGPGTRLVDASTGDPVATPDWSWSDGETFWAAFFPSIDNTAHPFVDLEVVYLPGNDTDGSADIELI